MQTSDTLPPNERQSALLVYRTVEIERKIAAGQLYTKREIRHRTNYLNP